MSRRRTATLAAVTTLVTLAGAPAAAHAFNPVTEAQNFAKTQERANFEFNLPDYRVLLTTRGAESEVELAQIRATDPERDSSGSLCEHHMDGCAGDVRLWAKYWQQEGHGIVSPVLWTARDGAVISGHVWATRAGPALRPGIVITTGSVQAPEELYVSFATTLAKEGFVVLTWDVQGQGRSDTFGEAPDRQEGVPSQAGQPFFDGTEDALDFFLSSPRHPYEPRRSCGNANGGAGTSHAAKQDRRVRAGLNAAYDPLSQLVDTHRIGIAGHSLGAGAVSYIGQLDPRVKAIVAWDNLRDVSLPAAGSRPECPSGSSPRPLSVPLTKPALGMAGDYPLFGGPKTADPNPEEKNTGYTGYRAKGLDSGELTIRGGDHLDFSYIPNQAFSATLRGMDLAVWYTDAWLSKYVAGDPTADLRLRTARWRDDAAGEARVGDPDPNLFSFYYRSPLDIALAGGGRFDCVNLRPGCPGLVSDDGRPPNYSYLAEATTADAATGPPGIGHGAGAVGATFDQRVRVVAPRLASDAGTTPTFNLRVSALGGNPDDIDHYELEASDLRGRRAYAAVAERLGDASVAFRGRPGRGYRFRARAIGRGGRVGPWAFADTIVPSDQGSARFSRGWATVRAGAAWGGSLRRATRRGPVATLRFRGSRIYVIGRRSARGGHALAVLDGRRRTLSFRSRGTRNRAVVATLRTRGRRTHTLRIAALGRSWVEPDAFGVMP